MSESDKYEEESGSDIEDVDDEQTEEVPKKRLKTEDTVWYDGALSFLNAPQYALLAEGIMKNGGFGVATTPGDGGRDYFLQNGLAYLLDAHDNDTFSFINVKDGKPPNPSSKLSERNDCYFQVNINNVRNYAVLFGTCSGRKERTGNYGTTVSAKVYLDNVTQSDVTAFQGRPQMTSKGHEGIEETPTSDQWDSLEDSVLYHVLEKAFCKELAAKTTKKGVPGSSYLKTDEEDPKFLNRYIRQYLGEIDQDDAYNKNKGTLLTRFKTSFSHPFVKVESMNKHVPCETASDNDKVSFDFVLPIDNGKLVTPEMKYNTPKLFKFNDDNVRQSVTIDDIYEDFPAWEEKRKVPRKYVMLLVQHELQQYSNQACPTLRTVVKKMYYKSADQDTVVDALE